MDSIEKAIRTAFAKGDPTDRAFREKVYRSAFGALDRALETNPNMTQAVAARRRETLLAAITVIETEFVPARPAAVEALSPRQPQQPSPEVQPRPQPSAPAPEVAAPSRDGREPAFAPTLDVEERRSAAPRRPAAADDGLGALPREGRRSRPRRRFRLLAPLLSLLFLAAVVGVIWWLFASGTARNLVVAPPQSGDGAGPRVPGTEQIFEGWLDVFTPADPATVAAPGDSRAEVMEEDGEQFMRIRSGASGSPVLFDVGQGILEQVAGRRAVFNVVARAGEGQGTQISVDCSLGELGDCGRKRYAVGETREEFLFEIDLPARDPGSGGTIAINPDIDGGGKSVDIYAIRVLPAQ